MPKKKSQSLPVQGSVQLFIANLIFQILRWVLGWLFGRLRPIAQGIVKILWPVLRGCLVVAGLIVGILVLQQLLARRTRLPAPDSE